MLVFGTQMDIVTFFFVSIEIVIFFYLILYRLARPDDKIVFLNIILIFLLITYNLTGGLLPDPNLPGSYFAQNAIAYATGFITPCYFPYYVYKAFGLEKMKFHAYKGVYLFLILPYFLFVIAFAISNDLKVAQNLLILPVLYALWVIFSLFKAIRYKYKDNFSNKESKEEVAVLFLSITPWVGLPFITYFDLSQAIEASITNIGFLLLLGLQVNRHIKRTRAEYKRLIVSEKELMGWKDHLQIEVDRRTKELEKMNEQQANTFINLVHETRTPLTLINNYLEEYTTKNGAIKELDVIRTGVNKITRDIISLFDVERFKNGFAVYDHNQILNFSQLLRESVVLFAHYCKNRNILCETNVEENIFIKADVNAINRIVNNLIENAIKFSDAGGKIEITLKPFDNDIIFSVKDTGIGIAPHLQKRIFEPYFQINNKKTNLQGMGLGLPLVKKVVEGLGGRITIDSNPAIAPGTSISITLNRYYPTGNDTINDQPLKVQSLILGGENIIITDTPYIQNRKTILLVEDNKEMINFLFKKLSETYNVFCALNGSEALKKLQSIPVIPDLILSDIMMDKMDGLYFAKVVLDQSKYSHIPIIFLTAKSTPIDKKKALQMGAIDFIQKPFSFEDLKQKIETLLNCISRQKFALLNLSLATLKVSDTQELHFANSNSSVAFEEKCKMYNLTNREIELIKLMKKGTKYKVISESLYISEGTVKKHIQNIFDKVEVSNKVELLQKFPF